MLEAFGQALAYKGRRPPPLPISTSILLAIITLLVACGGGGGGSTPPPALAPVASFTATPSSGEAPLEVTFNASASQAVEGTLTQFAWQFGDGNTGSGSQTSHTYTAAGSFQASLTVTNSAGRTASSSRSISVTPPPVTYRVSGTVIIGSASAADSSTNDPNAAFRANNDPASAQAVQLPVTIGGYVARPGAGPSGFVSSSGDTSDFYLFDADGGERVELLIGNPDLNSNGVARNDLDLYLYDETGMNLIDGAFDDDGATESLDIPESGGKFVLEVRAFSGASTYALTIGGSADGPLSTLRASGDFIPGEMLLGRKALGAAASAATPIAYQVVAERSHDHVTLARLTRSRQSADSTRGTRSQGAAQARSALPDAELRLTTLEAIKTLRRSGRYTWVEPNFIREAQQLAPNDPVFPNQWHYRNIQLPLAWERSMGNPDVTVAVIDTGVLLDHPDLQGQLLPGYDFLDNVEGAADPGDGSGAASFHGTHVTGTVAARTDNALGVAGVGWNTRVLPIRVLGRSGGSTADLREALKYAAGMENRSGIRLDPPVDIINLSLGGSGRSDAEQALFNEIRDLGIFVVAAAGNRSSSTPFYPAAYEGVLSVSATSISNRPASYSNFGAHIDLAAPGGERAIDGEVISTVGREIKEADSEDFRLEFVYEGRAGTSMAAPHVAGVIALMKAIHPDLTPELFDTLLAAGRLTDDLGEPGRDDRFGHGLINARKAVLAAEEAAGGTLVLPAMLTASPGRLDFDPFTDELQLTLGNAGTEDVIIDPAIVDAPWLSVEGAGLGSYRVSVDRDGLEDGRYDGSIRFEGNAETSVTVPVRLRVAAANLESDAGFHYVILADPDTGDVLLQQTATATNGRYSFVFENVPEGDYELYAGTDMNNNFLVCDEAEACGLFPTLDSPDILTVDQDLDGIEFTSGFRATRFDAGASADLSTSERRPSGARPRPRLQETHP
ncbi:MAG: S8 family serine peptidase [Gammaproteobacteria bacterium]|nr:S8 family serine peptidase [Gammaproteobacteria bacterium]